MCISQNHIPVLFVCQCTYARMHSRATRDSSTAFCASKLERLHAYFFARLIKRYLYHFFYILARSVFAFLVHPGALIFTTYLIVAYRTQARQKGICLYPLSITSLNYWAYIVFML